jgi:DNA polymerase
VRRLYLDLETYSEADLIKVGPWAYSMHPSTEVLMLAWAADDGEPWIWLPGQSVAWLEPLYFSCSWHAWNDFFEYCIIKNVLKWTVPPISRWHDVAAKAAALALPRSLSGCCKALGLPADVAKDNEGERLIKIFSKPQGGRGLTRRIRPQDAPGEFNKFITYCKQDVIAEREIDKRLPDLQKASRATWEHDRAINLRGVRFDLPTVWDAIYIRGRAKKAEDKKVYDLTGGELANIGSGKQLAEYLARHGVVIENAQAEYLKDVSLSPGLADLPKAVIEARLRVKKASLAKYDKLLKIIPTGTDRAYGLLRWHGAATGRWSGNLFQPQNLPRPSFDDTDACIKLFKCRDPELLSELYDEPLEALSSCIRGMIIPSPGCRFIASDFSQIESRVLKFLAGDDTGLDAYRQGIDTYKVNAAAAFKTYYEGVTKAQRTIGKVIELACGYQGGVGAFQHFAKMYGVKIPDAEAQVIIKAWREKNKAIVSYWYDVEAAAVAAVYEPGTVHDVRGIKYKVVGSGLNRFLYCQLPSGRRLAYHRPSLQEGKFGGEQVHFWGVHSKKKRYMEQSIYGGQYVQNICSGAAYDLLAHKFPLLEAAGYPVIFTVHDEIIAEVPIGHGSIEEFNDIMRINPPWAEGLPVDADGYEAERYRK